MINKNDPDYEKVYSETLETRIGKDTVLINEVDLDKEEYRFEKKLYKSGLSYKNYLPALIQVDKTINRTGLYYAFKDYLKGKRKRINKILKNLSEQKLLVEDMTTFQNYIDNKMLDWLKNNNLDFKKANVKIDKGDIFLFYNANYCMKIYDRLGHGFSVTVNLADKLDESVYDNDFCSMVWVYKYFQFKETASFSARTKNHYEKNLPLLINDLKSIIPILNKLTTKDWSDLREWISKNCT